MRCVAVRRETRGSIWGRSAWLLPALLALLCRLPCLGGDWVWDDAIIVDVQLPAFHSITDVFFPPSGIPNFSAHYYRPLTTASYLLDRWILDRRPWGFHLTSLVAHAIAASLLFLLVRSCLRERAEGTALALATSCLFASHPRLTEAVCWISGRADVLAGLFLIAASIALRARPLTWLKLCVATASFSTACLFKESAFAFIPLVPILAAPSVRNQGDESPLRHESPQRPAGPGGSQDTRPVGPGLTASMALFIVAASILFVLRMTALGGLGVGSPRQGSGKALLAIGGALAFYLPKAILPLPEVLYAAEVPSGIEAWTGLLFGMAAVIGACLLLVRARTRLVGLGLLWFFVMLAPALGPTLLNIGSTPLAERYLYIPLAGGSLALAGALSLATPTWRRALVAGLVLVIALFSGVSLLGARLWTDDLAFWTSASHSSGHPFPRLQLAAALDARNREGEAEGIYRDLLRGSALTTKQRAKALVGLGAILAAKGGREEALRLFEETVRLDPDSALGWYNLATVRWGLAWRDGGGGIIDVKQARLTAEAIQRAARLSRFDASTHLFLGKVEAALGHRREAQAALEQASRLDPTGRDGKEAESLLRLVR